MNVWIRADGNHILASGHFRRTMAIAQELKNRGSHVLFLLSGDESRDFFIHLMDQDKTKWDYLVLGVPYGKPLDELPVLEKIAEGIKPDWMLVDSYAVGESYFASLRKIASKTAYIDDLMQFDPEVDILLNYGPCVKQEKAWYQKAKMKLLGPSYVPLRPQFFDLYPKVRQEVTTVLIATGGTDPYEMAGALKEMVEDRGLKAKVVAPGYPYVTRMAGLMQECDLAFSAGGTTLYELCAAGVPAASFSMAENQTVFAESMATSEACWYLGDVQTKAGKKEVLKKAMSWLDERCSSCGLEIRQKESACMHHLTDGKGASRIADAILQN